jgi:hypothetical protein
MDTPSGVIANWFTMIYCTKGHKCQPFFVDLTSIFASFRVILFFIVLLCFTDNLFPQDREFGHVKGPATAEESERLWAFRQFLAVPIGCVWKH